MPKQAAVLVLAVLSASVYATDGVTESTPLTHTDRMIVKYKTTPLQAMASGARVNAMAERLVTAQRVGQQFGVNLKNFRQTATGAQVMKLDRKASLDELNKLAVQMKAQDPSIEYAEPDRMMKPLFTPNDARYSEQWDLFETTGGMRMPQAWDLATGSGVTVAVIDTGYRPHADLTGNLIGGYDFISEMEISNDGDGRDADARDTGDAVVAGECGNGKPKQDRSSSWHGTHVAGTIAAVSNNSSGMAGIAFNAKVLPLRVLGKCGGYTSDIADAIIWAAGGAVSGVPANTNKARVINMSLGGEGACDTTTQNAINSARANGAVVIVAAGNENQNAANSNPANCQGVVTVAATNRSGGRAYYSNYGSVVDVAAPGGDVRSSAANGILSTLNTGMTGPGVDNYDFYQGTSMATPHVAGVVALMLSKNPSLTPDQVETTLRSTTRAFPAACSQCGTGIVDAHAAVVAAGGGTTQPPAGEIESNNTMATANTVVSSGMTLTATMASSSDVDYFKVTLPVGKTLKSVMIPGSPLADYDLYLYGDTGTLLASSEQGAGRTDTVSGSNTGTRSVVRYVAVKYYSGGVGTAGGKYSIQFTW